MENRNKVSFVCTGKVLVYSMDLWIFVRQKYDKYSGTE